VVVVNFTAMRPLSARTAFTPTPTPAPAPAPTPPVRRVGATGVVEAVALVVVVVVVTGVTDQRDECDGKSEATAVGVPAAVPLTPLTTPRPSTTPTVTPSAFRRLKRATRERSKATTTHFQDQREREARRRPHDNRPPQQGSFAVGRSFQASARPPAGRRGVEAWLTLRAPFAPPSPQPLGIGAAARELVRGRG
jgi:negative regulator of sigma E activity